MVGERLGLLTGMSGICSRVRVSLFREESEKFASDSSGFADIMVGTAGADVLLDGAVGSLCSSGGRSADASFACVVLHRRSCGCETGVLPVRDAMLLLISMLLT